MAPINPFSPAQLKTILAEFRGLKILVIGDLILDQYIWGTVERISPEAPVPVVNVTRKEMRLGGAGNVAANLAALGCQTTLAGVCGNDFGHAVYLELLKAKDISPQILISSDRPTTLKTRIIAQHQQVVRLDEENATPLPRAVRQQMLEHLKPHLSTTDGLIISDYAKGLITEELMSAILTLVPDRPVLVDPKGYHYKKYRGATAIKPNFKEFCAAVRHPDLKIADLDQPARHLVSELNLKGLIVTLGEYGVYVLDEHHESYRIPTRVKEVFDVSGAGDTFIAAFCAAFLTTQSWRHAAEIANLAAGVAVGKVGTATVSPDEILAYL